MKYRKYVSVTIFVLIAVILFLSFSTEKQEVVLLKVNYKRVNQILIVDIINRDGVVIDRNIEFILENEMAHKIIEKDDLYLANYINRNKKKYITELHIFKYK